MANRRIEYARRFLTHPQVQHRLGLSRFKLDLRIERGILPKPTFTDATSGVRYFSEQWVTIAQAILQQNGGG